MDWALLISNHVKPTSHITEFNMGPDDGVQGIGLAGGSCLPHYTAQPGLAFPDHL